MAPEPTGAGTRPDAPERIVDAAIACIAEHGPTRATLRRVAAAADVSPGLIVHHFGGKEGLRAACDRTIARRVAERKLDAMRRGAALDPVRAFAASDPNDPTLRYLARVLAHGGPAVDRLIDDLIDQAETAMDEGVAAGLLRPARDGRARAAVLTLWSLGALALHEQVRRVLGTDLAGSPAGLAGESAYVRGAMEILGGVLTPDAADAADAARDAACEPARHAPREPASGSEGDAP